MRKILTSPFALFVAVVGLMLLIEAFSILGVHMVTQAYSAEHCARLADGDTAFKSACKAFEKAVPIADDAFRESRVIEETGQLSHTLLRERAEKHRQSDKLEQERKLLLRELLSGK